MTGISDQAKELKKIWGGFQASRVLITANNLGVFDYLQDEKSVRQLARLMGTDRRATEILLDALAGLGLLKKKNDKYRNGDSASRFLVSGTPYYQGDIIRHAAGMWDKWSSLDAIVTTGKPSEKSRSLNAFILGMHNIASLKAGSIIDEINLRGVTEALDLGGGPGTYSLEFAKRGINATLFDLPDTLAIARDVLNRSPGRAKKIKLIGGDFKTDAIGSGYDLVFISQILHMFSDKVNIELLKKCRKALGRDGQIVIQEFLINENRTDPEGSALFAINMLVHTSGGRSYSPGEMKSWLQKAGFKNIRKKIMADIVLVSARL